MVDHEEACPALRAGLHGNADLDAPRGRWPMLLHHQRGTHIVKDDGLHGLASVKRGFHLLPECLDVPKIWRAPLTMRLTTIGNQSILANIIHRPALDDDQIAAVGDIDVSQDCEQLLKLRENVLLMEAVVLPRSWSLRTLITDDHEALSRRSGSWKARSPLIIPEDQAGCGWSYAVA